MLGRWHIEWRRRLSAGQREVVLAGQVHLPHGLGLQLAVALAAVPETLPLPSLRGIAVLADAEPVRRASGRRTQTDHSQYRAM